MGSKESKLATLGASTQCALPSLQKESLSSCDSVSRKKIEHSIDGKI